VLRRRGHAGRAGGLAPGRASLSRQLGRQNVDLLDERIAVLRAPLVSILPPALPHSLSDRPGSNTLLLSIAAPFFV